MTTPDADAETYEQWLWKKLNALLADLVPEDASEDEAERAVMLALMGHDFEIHALHEEMRKAARDREGYLRKRLEEDNLVSAARRRLYGRWA
ncbi:MAG TPA: hypothetical protein VK480_08970 [Solirubrobacterales bacterium]|nr:hypothetical protein [Solirubrobacterales bacterium]